MLPENFKPEGSALKRWVYYDDIIKYTGSRTILKEELEKLLHRKTTLRISKGGFCSSPTILREFNRKKIILDIPAIWQPIHGLISIKYSAKGQPHREMRAKMLSQSPAGLVLTFPYLVSESEHRQFYRISVPALSMLIAYSAYAPSGKKRILFEGKIRDISMKGICALAVNAYSEKPLSMESRVSEIYMKLMLSSSEYFGDIKIKEPQMVRCENTGLKQNGKTGYEVAFTFKPDRKTSDRIFTYMRQREQRLLG